MQNFRVSLLLAIIFTTVVFLLNLPNKKAGLFDKNIETYAVYFFVIFFTIWIGLIVTSKFGWRKDR
jgi:hypothetical protein